MSKKPFIYKQIVKGIKRSIVVQFYGIKEITLRVVHEKHKNDLKRIEFDTKLKPLEPLRFCKWGNFVYSKLCVQNTQYKKCTYILLLRLPFVYIFFMFLCI